MFKDGVCDDRIITMQNKRLFILKGRSKLKSDQNGQFGQEDSKATTREKADRHS